MMKMHIMIMMLVDGNDDDDEDNDDDDDDDDDVGGAGYNQSVASFLCTSLRPKTQMLKLVCDHCYCHVDDFDDYDDDNIIIEIFNVSQ